MMDLPGIKTYKEINIRKNLARHLKIILPAEVMGSWAWQAVGEILARMEAKSGELTNVHKFSITPMRG
jgi:hypothetical protein